MLIYKHDRLQTLIYKEVFPFLSRWRSLLGFILRTGLVLPAF